MVNQPLRGITIFRTIYFLPVVMVLAVVSVLWRLLFAQGGMINAGIGAVTGGSVEVNWLHDPALAFPAVMVASIWQNVGFQMILLLAGLQAIPADLYEAARVDGANGRQLFRHITLPGVRNTLIFVMTISVVTSFLLFDQPYVMTGGGPAGATQTLMLLMAQVGFAEQRIGQASAIAVIFFVIVLGVALISRRFGPRMTEAN
jgi:multiple sugar transport system permease protein